MALLTNWPLPSFIGRHPVASSGFGPRGKAKKMHYGLDLDYRAIATDPPYQGVYTADRTPNFYGPPGLPVVAAAGGLVKISRTEPRSRGVVEIAHPASPGAPSYRTIYRHLSDRYVSVGDWVDGGTRIGIMGASADTPFRHLHFAVKQNGKLIDPAPMLKRAGVGVLTVAETTAPPKQKPSLLASSKKGTTAWAILILLGLLAAVKSR